MLAMSEDFCEHDHCCFGFSIRWVLAFCLFSRQNWREVSEKSQMTSQEMGDRRYRSETKQRIFIGLLMCAQTRKTSVRFILLSIFSSCLSRNHKSTLQKTCWLVRNWTTTFAYDHRGGIDREVQYVAEDSTLTVAKSRICRRRRLDNTVLSNVCDILTKETSFAKLIRQYFQLFRFLSNARFMPLDVTRPEALRKPSTRWTTCEWSHDGIPTSPATTRSSLSLWAIILLYKYRSTVFDTQDEYS